MRRKKRNQRKYPEISSIKDKIQQWAIMTLSHTAGSAEN